MCIGGAIVLSRSFIRRSDFYWLWMDGRKVMEATKCRSFVDIAFSFPIALVELEKRENGRGMCVFVK